MPKGFRPWVVHNLSGNNPNPEPELKKEEQNKENSSVWPLLGLFGIAAIGSTLISHSPKKNKTQIKKPKTEPKEENEENNEENKTIQSSK